MQRDIFGKRLTTGANYFDTFMMYCEALVTSETEIQGLELKG